MRWNDIYLSYAQKKKIRYVIHYYQWMAWVYVRKQVPWTFLNTKNSVCHAHLKTDPHILLCKGHHYSVAPSRQEARQAQYKLNVYSKSPCNMKGSSALNIRALHVAKASWMCWLVINRAGYVVVFRPNITSLHVHAPVTRPLNSLSMLCAYKKSFCTLIHQSSLLAVRKWDCQTTKVQLK